MKDKLVEYVVELNTNPAALEKHHENIEKAAQEFGLDESDVKLMTTQNTSAIKERCAACESDTKHHIIMFFKS